MDLGLPSLGPAGRVATGSFARELSARGLWWASVVLARLAGSIAAPAGAQVCAREPVVEFHWEAGAPEGALYVDGKLIGTLPGVRRL